jgi:hypothetical protein
VTPTTATLGYGFAGGSQGLDLRAYVYPETTTDKSVTWTTSNPDVVQIGRSEDDYVNVYSTGVGTATVTATTNDGSNLSNFCTVIVADETYQLGGTIYPMIGQVDLGLPSGTLWADMNIGADAPFRMSNGFEGKIDITPYVGSGWEYPTEAEFRELIDNCDVKMKWHDSDIYSSIRMGSPDYYSLYAAVLTSRINGNKLHLYAYTINPGANYCYLYPYSLEDGNTFSVVKNVKECALKPEYGITSSPNDKVLIRLLKRGQGDTSIKDAVTMSEDHSDAAPYFDLQGRRLMGKPSRGLYIQDGKKYVK